MNISKELEINMTKARYKLFKDEPFYGVIAAQLDWVVSDDIPTCATDGRRIIWNPEFFEKLEVDHIQFIIIHEIHHVIKLHQFRMKTRHHMVWNIACDHQINLELRDEKYTNKNYAPPPKSIIEICMDNKYKGMLEEQIYDDLMKDANIINIEFNSIGDVIGMPGGTAEEEADQRREIEGIITKAAAAARQAGKLPGGLRSYIDEFVEPQVPWKTELQRFMEPIVPTNPSWSPPNRRLVHTGIYMPGVMKDGIGEVAIGFDTSGSISDSEIKVFWNELKYIFDQVKPSKVHSMYFHSHVWHYDCTEYGVDPLLPTKIESGGTSFQSVWDKIEENNLNIKCLIMFTDMYDSFPPVPHYPVIWMSITDLEGPYGKTIKVKI